MEKEFVEFDKQETIEEFAEHFWLNDNTISNNDKAAYVNGFITCTKWQQEQYENKYSEEDMIEFALFLEIHLPMKPRKTHHQLLEQFKTK